ncbi:MAG: ribosome-associated translation inhibitor RaiA [Clostridia bacterium]|nr:ribosome-associated translation inhibitor RaiA [Clostridia bacterium]
MKVIISGRRIEIEERLKELIEKKLSKLDKFFREDAEAKVTLTGEKGDRSVMEVTVFSGGMIYRAEENTDDAYTAIDKVVTVIERQIRKNKTRLEKRLRENAFDASNFETGTETEEEKEFNVVKQKKIALKPMSTEEAILQMNLLGHAFFVFKDAVTEETKLVYKRNDKDYGLIEME